MIGWPRQADLWHHKHSDKTGGLRMPIVKTNGESVGFKIVRVAQKNFTS